MRIEEANQAAWESIEPVDPFDLEQYREETGFTENFQAAYGNFVDENQITSQYLHTADLRERNEQLRAADDRLELGRCGHSGFACGHTVVQVQVLCRAR